MRTIRVGTALHKREICIRCRPTVRSWPLNISGICILGVLAHGELLTTDGSSIDNHHTPGEMIAQTKQDLHDASPLAALGHELDLIHAHRTLAESGCHFLVAKAQGDVIHFITLRESAVVGLGGH